MLCAMRLPHRAVPVAAALLALLSPLAARADGDPVWPQPAFVESPLTSDGGHLLEGTAAAPKWTWHAKIGLRWLYGVGVADRAHQTRADLAFGLGLPARLEADLALPAGVTVGAHSSRGESFALVGMGDDGAGIGDLRAALLWSARSSAEGGFGLLFGAAAIVPTGGHERLLGEGGFGGEAFAALALQVLSARVGLNLGYRLRPEHVAPAPGARFEQDDDLLWRFGIRVPRAQDVAWSIEAAGAIGVATGAGPWPAAASRPVWLGGGVDFPLARRYRFGLLAGFGIGEVAPLFTIGARFTFVPVLPDEDADGLSGSGDECPLFPEDRDGFEDADGCPDGDNDRDGFPDDEDACPGEAAGEGSEDGC
jgi:hypothetical protein